MQASVIIIIIQFISLKKEIKLIPLQIYLKQNLFIRLLGLPMNANGRLVFIAKLMVYVQCNLKFWVIALATVTSNISLMCTMTFAVNAIWSPKCQNRFHLKYILYLSMFSIVFKDCYCQIDHTFAKGLLRVSNFGPLTENCRWWHLLTLNFDRKHDVTLTSVNARHWWGELEWAC